MKYTTFTHAMQVNSIECDIVVKSVKVEYKVMDNSPFSNIDNRIFQP